MVCRSGKMLNQEQNTQRATRQVKIIYLPRESVNHPGKLNYVGWPLGQNVLLILVWLEFDSR